MRTGQWGLTGGWQGLAVQQTGTSSEEGLVGQRVCRMVIL